MLLRAIGPMLALPVFTVLALLLWPVIRLMQR